MPGIADCCCPMRLWLSPGVPAHQETENRWWKLVTPGMYHALLSWIGVRIASKARAPELVKNHFLPCRPSFLHQRSFTGSGEAEPCCALVVEHIQVVDLSGENDRLVS